MKALNFKGFGYREIRTVKNLLNAYLEDKIVTEVFNRHSEITIGLNEETGYVFLIDEDYNVAMLYDGYIQDYFSCPECNNEGFRDEFELYKNDCCKEHLI